MKRYLQALQGLGGPATIDALDEDRLLTLLYEVNELDRKPADDVESIAKSLYDRDKQLRLKRLASALVACLYKMGAVLVKLRANRPYECCYGARVSIEAGEVTEDTPFVIHPMLSSSFGAQPSQLSAA